MRVEPFIQSTFDKYLSDDNDIYLFNFHQRYSNSDSFNANVNIGIRKICANMGMKKENYYCSVIVISFADALYTLPNITVIIATSVIIAIVHLLCFAFNFAFFFSSRFSRKFIIISCFVISCVVIKVKPLSLLVP